MDDYNRRHFIRTSLPGFLGLSLALPGITALATRANACQGRIPTDGAINWDAFLTAVEKEASKQHLDQWNQDSYVKQVAALALHLNLKDADLAEAFENSKKGLGNKRPDFYKLEKQRNFEVSLVQFEKGEKIRHHDHPDMTGVLLCATGHIDVWNYDLLPHDDDAEKVLLKETAKSSLLKGQVSTLTSKARNIHKLRAHQLTQLVDIFAPPYNKERIKKSNWFEVDTDNYQGKDKIYEASLK
jgi:hypothetical protein